MWYILKRNDARDGVIKYAKDRGIKSGKSNSFWLAQFNRKMSFYIYSHRSLTGRFILLFTIARQLANSNGGWLSRDNFKSCPGRSGTIEQIWTNISTFYGLRYNYQSYSKICCFSWRNWTQRPVNIFYVHNGSFRLWRWVCSSVLYCISSEYSEQNVHKTRWSWLLFLERNKRFVSYPKAYKNDSFEKIFRQSCCFIVFW